jgi:heme exporter protein B
MIKHLIENTKILNKENALIQLLIIYIILGLVTVCLTCEYENSKQFSMFFLVIFVPLFITQISDRVLFNDFKDGSLELKLTSLSTEKIILDNYISLFILYFTSCILILPLICLFLSLNFNEIILISHLMLINIFTAIIISILIGSCNCYFKKITNINFLIAIPLILPNLIISGLIINNYYDTNQLFIVLYGILLIVGPINYFCSSFLIKNIYNI